VIVILGTVRLPPENLEAARPVMAAMTRASRGEDGCIAYAYAQDVFEPGLIRVSEVWRDQAALDAHAKAPHLAEWRAAWPALGIGERRLMAYEAADAKPI
jgi:quinol monooxygenase YgiN